MQLAEIVSLSLLPSKVFSTGDSILNLIAPFQHKEEPKMRKIIKTLFSSTKL